MNHFIKSKMREAFWRPRLVRSLPFLALAVALLMPTGCGQRSSSQSGRVSQNAAAAEQEHHSVMLSAAMTSLTRLEEYDAPEIQGQAIDRLNQWIKNQRPSGNWKPDPLLAELPEELVKLPMLENLSKLQFSAGLPNADGMSLQETIWLRDISRWVRGDEVGEVEQAVRLFDWVVRNIQLESDVPSDGSSGERILLKPWEVLLLGRGTATDRAWLTILLCRQQGIDAGLVALPDPRDKQRMRSVWVGVLSEGEIYLFEPTLGLPLPSPKGIERKEDGSLAIRPATLSEVADDDALLRRLDVDPDHRYPLTSAEAQRAVVLVEASPAYLSHRMKLVESQLAGDDRIVLTVSPSEQAERFRKAKHVDSVHLWSMPYQVLHQELRLGAERQRPIFVAMMPMQTPFGPAQTAALGKGRMYHLKGRFTGEPNAAWFYLMARIPDEQLQQANLDDQSRGLYYRAKLDASYWLGLIAQEQGKCASAIDYLKVRTLEVAPNGPWAHGAVYNLARCHEASSEPTRAIDTYRADPAYPGNEVRAKLVAEAHGLKVEPPAVQEAQPDTKKANPAQAEKAPPAAEQASQPAEEALPAKPVPGKEQEPIP